MAILHYASQHPGALSLEYGTEDHILGAASKECDYIKKQ